MELAAKYYVYEWVRPDYNVAFYVGKGTRGRAWDIKNRNKHTMDVVKYLNKKGMKPEVRILAHFVNENSAFDFEVERIAFLEPLGELTNHLPGGVNGGGGMKGKKHKEDTKIKIGLGNVGKVISFETRKKLREINTGKKHTAEACAKMSKSRTGRIVSFETTQKQSKSLKASKNTPEGKEKCKIAAAKIAATPGIKEKRKTTREANNKKDPNYWENKFTPEEIFFIGMSALSKDCIKGRYGISHKIIDKIRRLMEAKLGVPPRKNFGFTGKVSKNMVDKCKSTKQSFWDGKSNDQRKELGRRMSEGRKRAKELREKGLL